MEFDIWAIVVFIIFVLSFVSIIYFGYDYHKSSDYNTQKNDKVIILFSVIIFVSILAVYIYKYII